MASSCPLAPDSDDATPHRLALESVERRVDDPLWLRYRVEPKNESR